MELVLLVGANPRNVTRGPRVRLHEGKWKLRIEGQKDSLLYFHLHSDTDPTISAPAENDAIYVVNEPRTAEIEFTRQGNETSITVFLELLS